MAFYIWRNSGFRVWLADRLVALAGWLNPALHMNPGRSEGSGAAGESAQEERRVTIGRLQAFVKAAEMAATYGQDGEYLAKDGRV